MVAGKRSRSKISKARGKRESKFKSGEVKITVDYGYDIHSLVISGKTWDRIWKGTNVSVRGQGFHWDGEPDQDRWTFNRSVRGAVKVGTDGGGQIYEGNFLDGNVWVDVEGVEVNLHALFPPSEAEVNLDEQLGPELALDK